MKQLLSILFFLTLTGFVFGQRTITGVLTASDTGETLIGASIQIKGTSKGAVTDFDGSYSIEANEGEILIFSYVGYEPQEITVGVSNIINVNLSSTTLLDEVVVVGYGEQKKESVVGAISQTKGEDIQNKVGGSDLRNSLTGILPGVVTLQGSGIPGGGGFSSDDDDDATQILIRGQSTWNGGDPLVLVDGVERTFADIDPNQVETISVLKDASATAVFGVKGANGVILITTKRGALGKPQLTFESIHSISDISRIHPTLGSAETQRLKNLAILNEVAISQSSWDFYVPEEIIELYDNQKYPELFPDTDWFDETTNDFAYSQKYALTVSGGTKFVKYFGSLSYLQEGDVLRTQDFGQGYDPNFSYDRYNFRSNLDFTITPTTTFSVNLAGYYGVQQRPDGNKFDFWKGVYGMPSPAPVRFDDGTWASLEEFDRFGNAVAQLNYGGILRENRSEVNTDFILNQKLDFITPGLQVQGRVAFDNTFLTRGRRVIDDLPVQKYIESNIIADPRFSTDISLEDLAALIPEYTEFVFPVENASGYTFVEEPLAIAAEDVNDFAKNNLDRSLFYQISLNYARSFGNHNVTALALLNRRENARGTNFTNFREDWVGRVTYDYGNRYLLEFNGAYNGSEKFDRDFRFGFFPSVAVGWVPSNEKFWDPLSSVWNKFKIRYSNGIVGNDEGIARWLYVGGFGVSNQTWVFGSPFISDSPYPWRFEGTIPNPLIQWEEAQKQNVGVELGFFNSAITVVADYFWENRTKMFLEANDRNIPIVFGAPPVGVNAGEVNTSGFEVEARYQKASATGFGYFATFNMSYAVDEVIFREDPELRPDYQKQAGFQIGQTRSILNQPGFIDSWDDVYTGVVGLQNNELLPGDFRSVDFNADGVIDQDDVVPFGYPARPQYTYSFQLGGSWKGFSAVVQFYGVFNINYNLAFGEFFQNNPLAYEIHRQAWSPELGTTNSATYRHLRFNTNAGAGTFWQDDKSYLKLQNVELAYQFGQGFVNSIGLRSARIFLTGNNVAFIDTDNLLEDRDRPRRTNRDFPVLRRFNLGINVGF